MRPGVRHLLDELRRLGGRVTVGDDGRHAVLVGADLPVDLVAGLRRHRELLMPIAWLGVEIEDLGEKLLDLVDDRLAIAATIPLPAGLASAEDLVALLGTLARGIGPHAAAAVAHRIYAAALLADVDEQIAVEAGARAWLGPDAPPATKEDVWPL